MIVVAIDPGPTHSGFAVYDSSHRTFRYAAKLTNSEVREQIGEWVTGCSPGLGALAVEMVESYGMPVGAAVFTTCVEVGRFVECIDRMTGGLPLLVGRKAVKVHHCGTPRAGDGNVRQALVDRFAPGVRNHGKGTKGDPSVFYGFHTDVWAAAALAVYVADTLPSVSLAGGVGEG